MTKGDPAHFPPAYRIQNIECTDDTAPQEFCENTVSWRMPDTEKRIQCHDIWRMPDTENTSKILILTAQKKLVSSPAVLLI